MTPKDIATVREYVEADFEWNWLAEDDPDIQKDRAEMSRKQTDAIKALSRLETALSSPPTAPTPDNNGWRPISSAPKNGTQIYVDAPQLESGCTIAYFERGHWRSAWDGKPFGFHVKQPTKWQPLPPPPALDKGE